MWYYAREVRDCSETAGIVKVVVGFRAMHAVMFDELARFTDTQWTLMLERAMRPGAGVRVWSLPPNDGRGWEPIMGVLEQRAAERAAKSPASAQTSTGGGVSSGRSRRLGDAENMVPKDMQGQVGMPGMPSSPPPPVGSLAYGGADEAPRQNRFDVILAQECANPRTSRPQPSGYAGTVAGRIENLETETTVTATAMSITTGTLEEDDRQQRARLDRIEQFLGIG